MLTAIVPVSDMAGRLQNLENWLSEIHHLDIQVIIVHDFRDSVTEKQLLSILAALNSSKIVFLSGVFGSPGAARNMGLERADSNFVCFWDSDDLPHPQAIISELKTHSSDCDVLVGQYVRSSENSKDRPHTQSQDRSINDIAINPGLWRVIFRRDFVSSVKFKTMRMGEDQLFLAEIMALKPRVSFTLTVFYDYFVGHPGQLTQSPPAIFELFDAYREILTLRKGTSGREFEFNSFIISRMTLTLVKFAVRNKAVFLALKYIFSPSNLITRHPLLQTKCAFTVLMRLARLA